MTLQSSGPISLQNLQDEFGGSAPISLSEYYRGGGLVPNTGINVNVPISGSISLQNFYSASVSPEYTQISVSLTSGLLDSVVDYYGFVCNVNTGVVLAGSISPSIYQGHTIFEISHQNTGSGWNFEIAFNNASGAPGYVSSLLKKIEFVDNTSTNRIFRTAYDSPTGTPGTSVVGNTRLISWLGAGGGVPQGSSMFNTGSNYTINLFY